MATKRLDQETANRDLHRAYLALKRVTRWTGAGGRVLNTEFEEIEELCREIRMNIGLSPLPDEDDALLRRLIIFCHPDRHPENVEEATTITATLNALRAGCQAQGWETVIFPRGQLAPHAAVNNWRCATGDTSLPISMEQACKWQCGLNAVQARFTDLNDAFTWVCYTVGNP